jgi:hypothetical protein
MHPKPLFTYFSTFSTFLPYTPSGRVSNPPIGRECVQWEPPARRLPVQLLRGACDAQCGLDWPRSRFSSIGIHLSALSAWLYRESDGKRRPG